MNWLVVSFSWNGIQVIPPQHSPLLNRPIFYGARPAACSPQSLGLTALLKGVTGFGVEEATVEHNIIADSVAKNIPVPVYKRVRYEYYKEKSELYF